MRRFLTILLSVTILFSISACGSQKAEVGGSDSSGGLQIGEDKYAGQFRVGFARVSILPDESVPLGGYGNVEKRLSTGYLDDIYANCIAVSDVDGSTVLLYSVDLIGVGVDNVLEWKPVIAEATGVEQPNILVNASHTHSAPDIAATSVGTLVLYNKQLQNALVECAVKAMDNRSPAEMYYGETEAYGLNFVRHYFGDDGTCLGDNHNDTDYTGTIVRHTSDADPTLYMLKFARTEDKDVYYTNFRAHATMTGGLTKYDISADFVGYYRECVEEALDAYCTYNQGAAGNINPKSRIDSENTYTYFRDHGKALSEYAINLASNLTKVETGKVQCYEYTFTANINHDEDNKVGFAQIVQQYWTSTNDSTGSKRLAMTYGIFSQYHANAIIAKSKLGATGTLIIHAVSIGKDVGITFVPYEQFDTNGCFIIENSPYKYTIANGYTNGRQGYIPSNYGYDYGCYESDTGRFEKGTGEAIASQLVTMLDELKALS